jgi:hypothetical protein
MDWAHIPVVALGLRLILQGSIERILAGKAMHVLISYQTMGHPDYLRLTIALNGTYMQVVVNMILEPVRAIVAFIRAESTGKAIDGVRAIGSIDGVTEEV